MDVILVIIIIIFFGILIDIVIASNAIECSRGLCPSHDGDCCAEAEHVTTKDNFRWMPYTHKMAALKLITTRLI
eukprot:12406348-Karenia_brevis.AAC.1